MGMFDFFKAKSAAPTPITLSSSGMDSGRGSYITAAQFENKLQELSVYWDTFQYSPWIQRMVKAIARAASKKWRLLPSDPDAQIDESATEPIVTFLNQPNPQDSFESLVFKIVRDLHVFGCCFLEVQTTKPNQEQVRGIVSKAMSAFAQVIPDFNQEVEDVVGAVVEDGLPTYLRVLPAQQIEVITDEKGRIQGYMQWTDQGKKIPFGPNDILHILHPDSQSPTYGESPIRSLTDIATIDKLIDTRQKKILQNDNTIDTIFKLPNTNESEVKKFHEQMVNQYRGAGSTGRFITTTSDVGMEDISKAKDGDFLNQGKDNRDTIALVLGVPLPVLGESVNQSNGSGGTDNHMRNFVENTVRPVAIHVQNVLNREIISRYESIGLNYIVELILEDTDDQDQLEQMWDRAVRNGTMTLDEVREKRGQEPLPDGNGAVAMFIGEGAAVTVESIVNPPEPIAPTSPPQLEEQPQEDEQAEKAIAQLRSAIKTLRKAL